MSGSGAGQAELLRCVRRLRSDGFRVRMFRSRPQLDRWLAESDRRHRLRCIVAAGGDGTVGDLLNRHAGVAIVPFPLGTENLVARYLKIRRNGEQVAAVIRDGHCRTLDTATANGRDFLLMLSAGVDADIVRRVHSARRGHIRRWNYAWPILIGFLTGRPHRIHVTAEDSGQQIAADGGHVVVTNIPAYGFGFRLSPDARPDDGRLDVRVVRSTSRIRILLHALTLRLLPAIAERDVIRFRTDALQVTSADASSRVPVQADGDPFPDLPLTVRICPGRLTVMIPATAPRR